MNDQEVQEAIKILTNIGQGVLIGIDDDKRINSVLICSAAVNYPLGPIPRLCVDVTEQLLR